MYSCTRWDTLTVVGEKLSVKEPQAARILARPPQVSKTLAAVGQHASYAKSPLWYGRSQVARLGQHRVREGREHGAQWVDVKVRCTG